MEYRNLGATGLSVSVLGIGMGRLPDRHKSVSTRDASEVVRYAAQHGVTLFDTAASYAGGQSEVCLGLGLAGLRSSCTIISKVPCLTETQATSPKQLRHSVHQSLRRLRSDYIDVVLLHNPSTVALRSAGGELRAHFEQLVSEGSVRYFGASVSDGDNLRAAIQDLGAQVVETRFNALQRAALPAMSAAAQIGTGIVVKRPLESGLLSGKSLNRSNFDRARRSQWSQPQFADLRTQVQSLETRLPPGSDLLTAALHFVISKSCVSSAIPGARSIEQVKALIAAMASMEIHKASPLEP